MWKYTAENDYPNISLHDCRISNVLIDKNDIVFEFDDKGFWIVENNSQNPFNKTLRTDKSEIRFKDIYVDFTRIYYYKTYHLFKKAIFTKRIELTIEQFASKINNSNWKFEFVEELYAWSRAGFDGFVWFDKKPYEYECQIRLFFNTMIYSWNKICEDRPW